MANSLGRAPSTQLATAFYANTPTASDSIPRSRFSIVPEEYVPCHLFAHRQCVLRADRHARKRIPVVRGMGTRIKGALPRLCRGEATGQRPRLRSILGLV